MSVAAYALVPLLVLGAVWAFLVAVEGTGRLDRRQAVRVGAGCVGAALLLTVVGVASDHHDPAPTTRPVNPGSGT